MNRHLNILIFIGLTINGFSQNKDSLISVDFSSYLNSRNGWVYESPGGLANRYCNGFKCNGEIIDTLFNGKIIHKAFYVEGKPHGIVTYFYPNGEVKSIGKCDNGTRVGIWNFYFENGNIESEITYDPTLPEPKKWIDYYENGNIESKFEYNDEGIPLYHYDCNEKGDTAFAYFPIDFENFVYEFYERHANGQVKETGQQKFIESQGWVKIGTWRWFDENGILTKEINYVK
jgi:antitoxin component YwqK of YwqJK toxin-antitoxin module